MANLSSVLTLLGWSDPGEPDCIAYKAHTDSDLCPDLMMEAMAPCKLLLQLGTALSTTQTSAGEWGAQRETTSTGRVGCGLERPVLQHPARPSCPFSTSIGAPGPVPLLPLPPSPAPAQEPGRRVGSHCEPHPGSHLLWYFHTRSPSTWKSAWWTKCSSCASTATRRL